MDGWGHKATAISRSRLVPSQPGFHGNRAVQHISPCTTSPQRSWQHGRGRHLALLKQIIKTWTKECNLPKKLNSEDASITSGCTHQGQQQPLALFPLLTASMSGISTRLTTPLVPGCCSLIAAKRTQHPKHKDVQLSCKLFALQGAEPQGLWQTASAEGTGRDWEGGERIAGCFDALLKPWALQKKGELHTGERTVFPEAE